MGVTGFGAAGVLLGKLIMWFSYMHSHIFLTTTVKCFLKIFVDAAEHRVISFRAFHKSINTE